jgi:hypothetical protein
MAETLKVLGQLCPGNVLSPLYTVPAATSTVCSSIVVANQSAQEQRFRISVAVAGAADDPKQYLHYDVPVGPNDTFIATIGATLGAADVVRVLASSSQVSFTAFGAEEA